MISIIKEIRQALSDNVDERALASSSHFFKEGERAKVYGVKMAVVRKIGKECLKQIKTLDKYQIFGLCEQLWKSAYLEEAVIACMFSESLQKQYEPADFKVFEHWVHTYLTNWADTDTFCTHTVGAFLMEYPEYLSELKKWAKSPNRWARRAAAVSLIIPAKKALFLDDIFEIADILLLDTDHIVQKGYGWMLKVCSEVYLTEVFDYVMKYKKIMPRTALRYAIEKMPVYMKAEAMTVFK